MRKVIIFLITLATTACSNPKSSSPVQSNSTEVVNPKIDSVFAQMIDSGKKYLERYHVDWEDAKNFKRDSLGNRLITVSYTIENSGMEIEYGSAELVIKEELGDIVITKKDSSEIFVRSKDIAKVHEGFTKALTEILCLGKVTYVKAKML